MMITNLSIQNYRGIAHAELTGLRQFSVVTGANNAGKTTVLEAMALLVATSSSSPIEAARVVEAVTGHRQIRGDVRQTMRFDRSKRATISSTSHGVSIQPHVEERLTAIGSGFTIEFKPYPSPDMFGRTDQVCFVAAPSSPDPAALEELWSFAVKTGYSPEVLKASQRLDPSIVDLQLIVEGKETMLYAQSDLGQPPLRAWPVAAGGSGFKRLLSLFAQVSGATGLVCIDDPDAFLHPRMFGHLATLLWGLVRNGAQVVVATHNPELIDAFARDINGPPESGEFGVFGFRRDANGTLACELRLHGAQAQNSRRRDDIRQLLGLS